MTSTPPQLKCPKNLCSCSIDSIFFFLLFVSFRFMRQLTTTKVCFVLNFCPSNIHMWQTHGSRLGPTLLAQTHTQTETNIQSETLVMNFAVGKSRRQMSTGSGTAIRWDGCSPSQVSMWQIFINDWGVVV